MDDETLTTPLMPIPKKPVGTGRTATIQKLSLEILGVLNRWEELFDRGDWDNTVDYHVAHSAAINALSTAMQAASLTAYLSEQCEGAADVRP